MTRDLRTSIYCSKTLGPGMSWNPVGATSRCNRGPAVEADTIGKQQLKADAIREQQLK